MQRTQKSQNNLIWGKNKVEELQNLFLRLTRKTEYINCSHEDTHIKQ